VQQLINIAATGGGYGFNANDAFADPDSTGLALMALKAAGVPKSNLAVQNAIAYLQSAQLADGGYGFGTSNANSTGLALQGLAAYDEQPRSLTYGQVITDGSTSRLIVRSPLDAIMGLQLPDGSFSTQFSIPAATYGALPGVACKPLPLRTIRYQFFPIMSRQ
jgi:hypothetical protein